MICYFAAHYLVIFIESSPVDLWLEIARNCGDDSRILVRCTWSARYQSDVESIKPLTTAGIIAGQELDRHCCLHSHYLLDLFLGSWLKVLAISCNFCHQRPVL